MGNDKKRERPESVDAAAWWSPSDNEWVLGEKDSEGRLHGMVTYWRPDGTLVNHCNLEHGTPHGEYKRYHESGEVSRQGTFSKGKLQGTDVFTRSESETTENFPSGLGGFVWRAEMDMVGGRVVGGRLYNKEGRQVTEDGTLCPERPSGVPEAALYSSNTGRWLCGSTDDEYKRHGTWRFYDGDGWLAQEVEYSAGEVLTDISYANRFESAAVVHLREGRYEECDAAVQDGLAQVDDDIDELVLRLVRIRSMVAQQNADSAAALCRELIESVSPKAHWGRFMPSGQRAYNALAEVHAVLARSQVASKNGEDALTNARRAIELAIRPGAQHYSLKADALELLGREDEQFAALKTALSIDTDLPELAKYKADARFADWCKAIDPDSMSEEGAWALLGERGEKLAQYLNALVRDSEDDEEESGDRSEPVFEPSFMGAGLCNRVDVSALAAENPELAAFDELAPNLDISSYRGELVQPSESTLSIAVQTIDGNWLARIQSIFLPASIVLIDDESMRVASWKATGRGTSRVYSIHQDEMRFYHHADSISAMIVGALELGDDDQEFGVSTRLKNQWQKASSLCSGEGDFDEPFELIKLEPRTHWIVNLLVGKNPDIVSEIFLGEGIKTAASAADWEREKNLLAWPHLQAYWLFHHAIFDNHDALREVLEHVTPSYPPMVELADFAKRLVAGEAIDEVFWNPDRIAEYRAEAIENRPDLMSEEAKATFAKEHAAVLQEDARVKAALASLETEAENERLVGFLGLINNMGGELPGYEEAFCRQMEKPMDYFMSMKKGRVTPLEDVFRKLDVLPERIAELPSRKEALHELFAAALARGGASPDDHKLVMPGAIYALGVLRIECAADFEALFALVKEQEFYPEKFGAYRRLQVAMLAARWGEESAIAKEFLKQEAARYAEQAEAWNSDTFDFADRILSQLGGEEQLNALNERLLNASFSGANWRESVAIAERFLENPSALMATGLKSAVEKGLGRHDDGERAIVIRSYARCAGADARTTLVDWANNIKDVRKECEQAAIIAGLIELDIESDALASTLDQAHTVLGQLRSGSMKFGAAISLLETVKEHKLAGFAKHAETLAALAKKEKYPKEEQQQALAKLAQELAT